MGVGVIRRDGLFLDVLDGAGCQFFFLEDEVFFVVGEENEAFGVEEFQRCVDERGVVFLDGEAAALVAGKGGWVDDDDVKAEIFAPGVAEKFEGVHFVDPVAVKRQVVEFEVFFNPVAIGFGKVHAAGFGGSPRSRVHAEGASIGERVEDDFSGGAVLYPFAGFAVVKKKAGVQIVRKVAFEPVGVFRDDQFFVLRNGEVEFAFGAVFVEKSGDLQELAKGVFNFFEFLVVYRSKNLKNGIIKININSQRQGAFAGIQQTVSLNGVFGDIFLSFLMIFG